MGLLDKVKNILFDEEEVEVPIIKNDIKSDELNEENEIEKDTIKEIKLPKDDFSDKEYRSESTFTFPIDFEDEEPVIVPEKPVIKKPVDDYKINRVNEKKDYSDFLKKHDDKKKFKPTPIISPVYGVLDQNYKKEDVVVKKDVLRRPNELTLDEVRKRAFGTLEDEIDANLVQEEDVDVIKTKEEVKIKKEQIIEKKKELPEEPVDKNKTIGELTLEESYSIDVPELSSIKINDLEDNSIEEKVEPKNTIDDLLGREVIEEKEDNINEDEEDLFSLIDSMYEEKGE